MYHNSDLQFWGKKVKNFKLKVAITDFRNLINNHFLVVETSPNTILTFRRVYSTSKSQTS